MLKPSKPTPANCQMRDVMVFLSVEKTATNASLPRPPHRQIKIPDMKKGRPQGLPSGIVVRARHLWRRLTSHRLLEGV
ncbi:hypothetical protein YSA_03660 [Pseudomonas putida ND6]|uniref:Uncharacterized protein n=1 Tax=Pseudomonas putida ND6 TaxID=231023 RepID=I3UTC4_PSEPU|nr:hypothetical protein YSA_03660 [Pseudomonas putida ND6]